MPRAPSRIILESIVIPRFSIIIFSFYGNFKYNKQVRINARDSLSIKRFSDGDVDLNIWTDLKETRCQYPPPLQRQSLNLLVGHSNPTLICFQVLRTICRRLDFSFFFHFSNNFSLPVTLLLIIIRENLKKLIVNVKKQKDALKKNGIRYSVWSALCCEI